MKDSYRMFYDDKYHGKELTQEQHIGAHLGMLIGLRRSNKFMPDNKKTDEVYFRQGYRQKAIRKALELVRESGRGADLIICRDIPGQHMGGEDCFCDPKILQINPEELE